MGDGLEGLTPVEPRKPIGIMPNRQHQTYHGFMTGAPYELAIVEFDDQGRCYDRGQMDAVAQRLEALAPYDPPQVGQDVILVVFVHGWQHDARSDDDNLTAFRALLSETVGYEKSATAPSSKPRPVLGLFVGWRGLSDYGLGDVIADATFWGRQAAGQRVAVGSVRELFGRLRHYRNRQQKRGGNPLLVIVGHSFGGMIVFSALAQSLIQAASAPVGVVTPEFADLVLLVNPAIEAARYIPIYDLVTSAAFKARTTKQLPVFICAQAENDLPVGRCSPSAMPGTRSLKRRSGTWKSGASGMRSVSCPASARISWLVRQPISPSSSIRPIPRKPIRSGWPERRRKSSTDTEASGRRHFFSSLRASSSSTYKPHMSRWQSSGSFLGDQSPAVICPASEVLSPLA
jgi:pimeloyl-ACP methyl ester carboxylesterase